MAKNLFSVDQVVQLREIEKAGVARGRDGLHGHIQELIDRLTAGGVGVPATDDPFLVQTKVYWDLGWGRELGYDSLDLYRKSVERDCANRLVRPPGLPEHLDQLVLWDQRPLLVKHEGRERVSLRNACRLLGITYNGDDETFANHEATPEILPPVLWVPCQDGRRNRNRKPMDCRQSFVASEVGLEAIGGLFLFAQDRTVLTGHVMDLPGSVRRDDPSDCAYLELWRDGPELDWCWDDSADPEFGSASRWE